MTDDDTDVTVRRADENDADELTRLRRAMFADMGRDPSLLDQKWCEQSRAHFRQRLRRADDFAAFVIDQPNGAMAACAIGWLNPHLIGTRNRSGRSGYVANMSTDPVFRRRGYARRTLVALLDWMRTTGISTVDLHATADGEQLYRELGFAEPHDVALTLRLD